MEKIKLTEFRWFDVAALTVIMFAQAIYTSTWLYLEAADDIERIKENLDFSVADNYQAFFNQSFLLLLAFLYLRWRNFDFKIWHITPSLNALGKGILLFVVLALCMDCYTYLSYSLFHFNANTVAGESSFIDYPAQGIFAHINIPLIFYAALNGFYEEIFFLGICLRVNPKYQIWAFIYSLFIRFSFHTYQGFETALAQGFILGSLIYMIYRKSSSKNLFSFFVAHAIADVFGMGILYYFYPFFY